jgi:hypothetical protein
LAQDLSTEVDIGDEQMDHSIQSYLRRRTTEELTLLINADEETIPPEIRSLIIKILLERQDEKQTE